MAADSEKFKEAVLEGVGGKGEKFLGIKGMGRPMPFLPAREGGKLNRVAAGSGGFSSQSFSEMYVSNNRM